ncbi:hypothetical protein JHK86_018007 [Glycine max]|nr:hypothetical protein JHK86_018007 [Glycine max]
MIVAGLLAKLRFVVHLRDFGDIAEERTSAVGYVVERLGKKILGIQNELYPVTSSFSSPIFFSLEHVATPYFGIKIRLRVHYEFCPGLVLLSYFVLTSSLLKHV